MTEIESREAFEAWARIANYRGLRDKFNDGPLAGEYIDGLSQRAWESWTAAIAFATERERERCAKVCDEIAAKHLASGRYVSVVADHSTRAGGQVDGAEECAAAIRAKETG